MENLLEKLFESVPKARVLRLFLQNPGQPFELRDIVFRSKLRVAVAKKELFKLMKIALVKRKIVHLRTEVKRKSRSRKITQKVVVKSRKAKVYYVNEEFGLFAELRDLVAKSSVASREKLLQKIKSLGNVKLAIIAGTFLNHGNSRTDLLLVGDHIKKSQLNRFLSSLESELGRSLHYTLMDTSEFEYRLDMYDRFLRDILEYPHEKLINKFHI